MPIVEGVDPVGRILYCSIALEKLAAEVYRELAARLSTRNPALLLEVLSTESEAHAKILEKLAEAIEVELRPAQCRELVGYAYENLEEIKALLKSGDTVSATLELLLSKLSLVEISSEETYHKILLPLLKVIASTTGVAEVLEKIAKDESYHEELLELIRRAVLGGSS